MSYQVARGSQQFDKDRILRDVAQAQRLREVHRGQGGWTNALHRVQHELGEIDRLIRSLQDQRRPSEVSGSPRTQGKDSAEGLAVRALDKLGATLERLAKTGKQKTATLASSNPGAHASVAQLIGTFDAVLAIVFALRVWVQRAFLDRRALDAAQRKAERLASSVEQLERTLR